VFDKVQVSAEIHNDLCVTLLKGERKCCAECNAGLIKSLRGDCGACIGGD